MAQPERYPAMSSNDGVSRRHFFYGALLAGAVPAGGYGSVPALRALGYKPFYDKLNVASIGWRRPGRRGLGGRRVVQADLPQNKRNEDKLDSIISAYVAAYWWRFGVQPSTVIGDLATGYMVTPHSVRTLAALTRVFGGRMNPPGTASAPPPAVPPLEGGGARGDGQQTEPNMGIPASATLPKCDWVCFATTAMWSGTVTRKFGAKHNVIVRSVYNSAGIRIPNVQPLKPGERILLVHGGDGEPYRALFSAVISTSAVPVRSSQHCFDVFSYIDETLPAELEAGGYVADSVVGRFTGITITGVDYPQHITSTIPRPPGNNAIWRWDQVFGG